MKNARQTAFDVLQKIQRDNSYSNLTLDSVLDKSELEENDKAFACALVYGVTERIITLDYQLSLYLSQPLKKLKPQVLTIMRMGAFQLLFMDKIPSSAAVNESVKLAKSNQAAYASGLVNAVLHKIDKIGLRLPEKDENEYYSIKYSCPQWLCDMWIRAYGRDNAEELLQSSYGNVETTLRVNTLKTDSATLKEELSREGIITEKCDEIDDSLRVLNKGAIHKTVCYSKGLFHVQDIASQLCCKALNVDSVNSVLDICSAPGGKSFTLAQSMKNKGSIQAFDIYAHRLKLIDAGARRLGILNISTVENNGMIFNPKIDKADRILCDVPCSGLGVIRKKPEIRYKTQAEVDKLPEMQYSILSISVKYLKTNGLVVYSTCSLNPDENENVIKRFLNEHPEFETVRILPELKRAGEDTDYISLMPHIHNCDGFFIAALRKKNEDV